MRNSLITRRNCLLALASARVARAHGEVGLVIPAQPVPDAPLLWSDGQLAPLSAKLTGRVTAVQWIFTSCRATCPMQGAIFQRSQRMLPRHAQRGIQFLTLSVDPERDHPAALAAWLHKFRPAPGWLAATPTKPDLARLRTFFTQTERPADNHTTQVFLIDRQGALVWRTAELPEPAGVANLLEKLVAG